VMPWDPPKNPRRTAGGSTTVAETTPHNRPLQSMEL
jgi:hypothetical protein